jgi:Rap1a immunity proteins
MRRAILAGAFVLAAFPARALDPIPATSLRYGGNLQQFCAAGRQSGEYAMCWWFIAAVLEVLENNSVGGYKVCVPHLTNIDQAVKLTTEWIGAHPDSGIKAASVVTIEALAAAFPCKDPS